MLKCLKWARVMSCAGWSSLQSGISTSRVTPGCGQHDPRNVRSIRVIRSLRGCMNPLQTVASRMTADGSRPTVSTRSLHQIPSSRLEVSPGCSRCLAHLIGKKGKLFRRARPRTSVCFSSFCPSPRLHEPGLCRQCSLQVVVGVLRPPGHCLHCQRHTRTEVGRQARWGRKLGKERTWEKARFRPLKQRGLLSIEAEFAQSRAASLANR